MRAPATFVVLRHRLTHPEEGPAAIARHCNLHDSSVRAVIRRTDKREIWREADVLHELQSLSEAPRRKRLYFRIPNPPRFLESLDPPHWISGEFAAASEDYDLLPETLLVYLKKEDVEDAVLAVRDAFGKVTSRTHANLILAVADPWMYLDPDSDLVERGQRLLDYSESRHIQILRGLHSGRAL